jgi:hypothetical protein
MIEQEPKPTESGKPPAYWPASGDLRIEQLSARYSKVRFVSLPWSCLITHHAGPE